MIVKVIRKYKSVSKSYCHNAERIWACMCDTRGKRRIV